MEKVTKDTVGQCLFNWKNERGATESLQTYIVGLDTPISFKGVTKRYMR